MDTKMWFAEGSTLWVEFSKRLNDPVMEKALKILEDLGTPVNSLPPEGIPFLEWNAMLNASREGYAQCLRNLRALACPPVIPETGTLRPWQHFLRSPDEVPGGLAKSKTQANTRAKKPSRKKQS